MITNPRQLRVAQRKAEALLNQAAGLTDPTAKCSYEALAQEVLREVRGYAELASGHIRTFAITSVDDMGTALIKARIARGWSQSRLGSELGVTAQMVQKDEARAYEMCSVSRMAEILDCMGFELVGAVRQKTTPFSSRVDRSSFTNSSPSIVVRVDKDGVTFAPTSRFSTLSTGARHVREAGDALLLTPTSQEIARVSQ